MSGIGKKEVLEAAKVPVVLDLPGVGENMQEHVYTSLSFGKNAFYIFSCDSLTPDLQSSRMTSPSIHPMCSASPAK